MSLMGLMITRFLRAEYRSFSSRLHYWMGTKDKLLDRTGGLVRWITIWRWNTRGANLQRDYVRFPCRNRPTATDESRGSTGWRGIQCYTGKMSRVMWTCSIHITHSNGADDVTVSCNTAFSFVQYLRNISKLNMKWRVNLATRFKILNL